MVQSDSSEDRAEPHAAGVPALAWRGRHDEVLDKTLPGFRRRDMQRHVGPSRPAMEPGFNMDCFASILVGNLTRRAWLDEARLDGDRQRPAGRRPQGAARPKRNGQASQPFGRLDLSRTDLGRPRALHFRGASDQDGRDDAGLRGQRTRRRQVPRVGRADHTGQTNNLEKMR